MARLEWNNTSERMFEAGVDRGVLYTTNNIGVAWNGLISVKESSTGADPKPYYLDGEKYLNVSTREDFNGTIEAFTYPNEFGIHDGTYALATGLIAQQQSRRPFSFSYRTKVGNDVLGVDYGYKLHIVYNALAQPADKTYSSFGKNIDPMNFSWVFSTRAKKPKSQTTLAPMAHVIIDSNKTESTLLRYVEEQLYGSDAQQARLISIDDLFALFEKTKLVYAVVYRPDVGLNPLQIEVDYTGDLYGNEKAGQYYATAESRLRVTDVNGFYTLGVTADPGRFVEDPSDPGTYIATNNAMIEDPNDPGTYLIDPTLIKEDPNDTGTYVPYSYTSPSLPPIVGLIADPNDEGTYFIANNALGESLIDSGVYVINSSTVKDNPNEDGTYLY